MDARNLFRHQAPALGGGVVNSQRDDRFGVVLNGVQLGGERLRDFGPAESGKPFDLSKIGDGHDTGHDGNPNATRKGSIAEPEEIIVSKEQLGHDEIGPIVDLAFKVIQVFLQGLAFHMSFGIARHPDA
jgi:hypothetical protein